MTVAPNSPASRMAVAAMAALCCCAADAALAGGFARTRTAPLVRPSTCRMAASPQPRPLTAAVIGGGLGGLAAAIALRKVGVDAHVYERTVELRGTAGTGLTLWPNGLSALAAIDDTLVADIQKAGSPTTLIEVTTADGKTRLPNPTGDPTRFPQTYGQPMLNIRWAQLQRILASRLPASKLHLGLTFDKLEPSTESANRPAICLTSTASGEAAATVSADFVIGADGLNSPMRKALVDDGPPRDAGRTIWRSIIPLDTSLLPAGGCSMSAGAGKVGFLTHIGGDELYWSAFATDEAIASSGLDRNEYADVKAYLLAQFAEVYKVRECIARTETDKILERRVADRAPLVDTAGHAKIPWGGDGTSCVTLLGDAFHAMIPSLGQGANSSFEGAYRLATAVKATAAAADAKAVRSTLATALRQYEVAQMERVHWIVEASAQQGRTVYEDREEFMRKQGLAQDQMWGITFDALD